MMNKLDKIFHDAKRCTLCLSIPSQEVYKRCCIPFPVPTYCKEGGGINAKIIFILESAGVAEGGAGQTGVLRVEGNFDQTSKNGLELRKMSGISSDQCLYINSIMHAAINSAGKMRKPKNQEIKNCSGFLRRVIDTVNPNIVVPVGVAALAALNLVERHLFTKITKCAGKPFSWYGRIAFPLVHWGPKGVINRNWSLQKSDYICLGEVFKDKCSA